MPSKAAGDFPQTRVPCKSGQLSNCDRHEELNSDEDLDSWVQLSICGSVNLVRGLRTCIATDLLVVHMQLALGLQVTASLHWF